MNDNNQITSEKKQFVPREGSVEYKMLFGTPEEQKKMTAKFKFANKFFTIPLYKIGILPLFGAGYIFLLLYTKGRKTGKIRTTPLEYRKIDGKMYIFASRGDKTHWLRNLKANPNDVQVKIGFKKFAVEPRILTVEERAKIFCQYVKNYPTASKGLMGWDPKEDKLEETDFSFIAEHIPIVQLIKK